MSNDNDFRKKRERLKAQIARAEKSLEALDKREAKARNNYLFAFGLIAEQLLASNDQYLLDVIWRCAQNQPKLSDRVRKGYEALEVQLPADFETDSGGSDIESQADLVPTVLDLQGDASARSRKN